MALSLICVFLKTSIFFSISHVPSMFSIKTVSSSINWGSHNTSVFIYKCRICHNQLSKHRQPSEALANFRGPIPEELRNLTCIEELLIARVRVCGSIVRLGQRNNPSSFFGIKGLLVFLPQDTTRLINLLPMSPASLSDIMVGEWTWKISRGNFPIYELMMLSKAPRCV